MKKLLLKMLCLLSLVFLMTASHAGNPVLILNNTTILQHAVHDTTSYWVVTNGNYITFTKDSVPNQWVYKASKPATSVPNPDPSKKAPATVIPGGHAIRISLGNSTYIFRAMPGETTLRYITSIPNSPSGAPTPPTDNPAPKQ